MSIRRRNIQRRLADDLRFEQGAHAQAKSLLNVSQDLTRRALDERDKALEECGKARTRCRRFLDLAAELGRYFTEPPGVLNRKSDLFLLLKELAPHYIPATPPETLQSMLDAAGITQTQLSECFQGSIDRRESDLPTDSTGAA